MSLGSNPSARAKVLWILGGLLLANPIGQWNVWASVYTHQELRSVESRDESKIRQFREEELNQLKITLGRRVPTNRRAELYYRLAEIYMEAYRSEFLLEGRVHEKRLDQGIQDKFIDRSNSRPFALQGVKVCQEVIKFGIQYEKLDRIYYFLGFYFAELNDEKQSAHYYEMLVKKFPNSPFVGMAYKELGDKAYYSANYRNSAGYYESALRHLDAERSPPILHKLAWSYYRTKQYERAIDTMKRAIAECGNYKERYSPLRDEALKDMATLMTERGRVEEAIQYFSDVAGDEKYFPSVLEKLGRQYERNLEYDKGIAVYESLLKTHPSSHAASRVVAKLIEIDIEKKSYAEAVSRLRGYESPKGGDQETQAAAQNLRVLIRKTATEHHEIYRKKKTRVDLEIAEMFYGAYLDFFLRNEDPHQEVPEIQMYLAEVKRDLGKEKDAADLYRAVVISKDKRYAKESGRLWLSSIQEALKKAPHTQAEKPSQLELQFVEASDLFQSSLAQDPSSENELRASVLRTAQVLAGYSSTRSDAIVRIRTILSRWPGSPQALTAAQLWLQLNVDLKSSPTRVPELQEIMSAFQKNSGLMAADQAQNHGKLRAAIEEQKRGLKVEAIAQNEHGRKFLAAAKGYEEFAESESRRDLAEAAYLNAMNSYLKEDDDQSTHVLKVADLWSKRFPRSAKMIEPLRIAATRALITGKFETSGQTFHRIGQETNNPEFIETAARIYEGMGDNSRAQQEWSYYLESFKNSPRRWNVALALARSQELSRLDGEANRSYRYCAGGPTEFFEECTARLADLYLRNKDLEKAKDLYKQVAGVGRTNSKSSQSVKKKSEKRKSEFHTYYVGYARFRLADFIQREARFDPLELPIERFQKALNQRLNFLEPLSRSYQEVAQTGGPWGVAALNNLALFGLNLADEVDRTNPPSNLQGPALEKFKKNLFSFSQPLREKSKSIWNDAYRQAVGLNVLSPVLPEVEDRLADFRMPALGIGRAQGPQGRFHLAGIPADGGKEGVRVALQDVRSKLVKNPQDIQAWIDYGNLLWGDGKPLMAKLAYERALGLQAKNTQALNNLAVVKMSSVGEEDWLAVEEGRNYLEEALKVDDFYVPAKMNLATLFNYYRLFPRAKVLWEQVMVRSSSADAQNQLAVALQGLGKFQEAESEFQKASALDPNGSSKFITAYHEAARESLKGPDGAGNCLRLLRSLGNLGQGFEIRAIQYLKEKCELWKNAN